MKIVVLICRILLGLMFVVFGANILHAFLPPQPMPPADSLAGHFFAAFGGSGWIKVVGLFQLLGGVLVLIGGTAPLGLSFLAPVLVNIRTRQARQVVVNVNAAQEKAEALCLQL